MGEEYKKVTFREKIDIPTAFLAYEPASFRLLFLRKCATYLWLNAPSTGRNQGQGPCIRETNCLVVWFVVRVRKCSALLSLRLEGGQTKLVSRSVSALDNVSDLLFS